MSYDPMTLPFDQFERWVLKGGWHDAENEAPAAPLAQGALVAWTKVRTSPGGERVTCGVTEAHRALTATETYCTQPIPPEGRRITPLPSHRCPRCERLHALGLGPEDIRRDLVKRAMELAS